VKTIFATAAVLAICLATTKEASAQVVWTNYSYGIPAYQSYYYPGYTVYPNGATTSYYAPGYYYSYYYTPGYYTTWYNNPYAVGAYRWNYAYRAPRWERRWWR
jgi:hypothetical protein